MPASTKSPSDGVDVDCPLGSEAGPYAPLFFPEEKRHLNAVMKYMISGAEIRGLGKVNP